MFVCIEGVDGCGKSTQAKLLADRGHARLFKFPDDELETGKLIRAHLHKVWRCSSDDAPDGGGISKDEHLDALVFQCLQTVNKLERATDIRQCLAVGKAVVLDRYWPSAFAYGSNDGLDSQWLLGLHRSMPQPELFILLDFDPLDAVGRRPLGQADRYERDVAYQQGVRRQYLRLWEGRGLTGTNFSRWVRLDGRGSVEDVHKRILAALQ